MNIKTKFLEDSVDYIDRMQSMQVNFVDTTRKKNIYPGISIVLFVIILTLSFLKT